MDKVHELSLNAITEELASPQFLAGVIRKRWKILSYDHPLMLVAIYAQGGSVNEKEYVFRFELTSFPSSAPEVKIWDTSTNNTLAVDKRPNGSKRVNEAFKEWESGSVYRPWERRGVNHNNWVTSHPELTWTPNRGITFILEDLHGLISSSDMALV